MSFLLLYLAQFWLSTTVKLYVFGQLSESQLICC